MAEETNDANAEIQEILTDLDAILSDLSGGDQAGAEAIARAASTVNAPVAKTAAPKPAPAPAPKPAPLPPPAAEPVVPPIAAVFTPPPAAAAKPAVPELKVELAPREGTLPPKKPAAAPKPAAKPGLTTHPPLEIKLGEAAPAPVAAPKPEPVAAPKPEPVAAPKPEPVAAPKPEPVAAPKPEPVAAPKPEPVAAPKPEPAAAPKPPPVIAPKSVPAPVAAKAEGVSLYPDTIAADAPKEQIRRVAFFYFEAQKEKMDLFIPFLDQSALTVSKKPFYLRRALVEAVAADANVEALVGRAKAANAIAVLALISGMPGDKPRELSDACAAAGLSFRSVAGEDVQRRSVVVDIMVDLMLLPGES